MLLSSGTEDYFLGTYYFNEGPYHNPQAGVTHKAHINSQFAGYRVHIDDPLPFHAAVGEHFSLVWRNGDSEHCDDQTGSPAGPFNPAASRVFAYVLAYEWPEASDVVV